MNRSVIILAALGLALLAVAPAFAKLGDLNNDGKVDMKDIAIVAKAWAARPSFPNWNAICDLNKDGVVDMWDLATVARAFGT